MGVFHVEELHPARSSNPESAFPRKRLHLTCAESDIYADAATMPLRTRRQSDLHALSLSRAEGRCPSRFGRSISNPGISPTDKETRRGLSQEFRRVELAEPLILDPLESSGRHAQCCRAPVRACRVSRHPCPGPMTG